jgi:hypothetical protein
MRRERRTVLSATRPRRVRILVPLVAALACAALASDASGFLTSMHLFPPEPIDTDPVRVEAWGGFTDGCWGMGNHSCFLFWDNHVEFDLFAHDGWQPGFTCPLVVWGFKLPCELGVLPAGHYRVVVTEHHQSLRYPDPDVMTLEFDVRPSTGVRRLSWGLIRALFR